MAYNTAITFPPKSHTHSEYAPVNHSHNNFIVNNSVGSHGIGLKWTGDLVATVDATNMSLAMKDHTHSSYADINHTHNYVSPGSVPQLTALELSGANPYIDFHYNSSSADYTHRIIPDNDNFNFLCPGNALVNGKKISVDGHTHDYGSMPRVGENYNNEFNLHGGATYQLREHGPGDANRPTDHWYHVLTNSSLDVSYGSQLAMGMTNEAMYYRMKASSIYDWHKIVFFDTLFPKGALYLTTYDVNPATLFGFGQWEKVAQDRVLRGTNTGATGVGGDNSARTIPVPYHYHAFTGNNHPAEGGELGVFSYEFNTDAQRLNVQQNPSGNLTVHASVSGPNTLDFTSRTAYAGTNGATISVENAYYLIYVFRRYA